MLVRVGVKACPLDGSVCVHMADSGHCTADSNTLENSYTPMKKRRKKVKKNLSFQKKKTYRNVAMRKNSSVNFKVTLNSSK